MATTALMARRLRGGRWYFARRRRETDDVVALVRSRTACELGHHHSDLGAYGERSARLRVAHERLLLDACERTLADKFRSWNHPITFRTVPNGRTTAARSGHERSTWSKGVSESSAFWTDLMNDEDLTTFVAIDSETDALPVGHVRQHWSAEALARKDVEIRHAEELYRQVALEAAGRLTKRFAWALDARNDRRKSSVD
jgi:hypothetical protein